MFVIFSLLLTISAISCEPDDIPKNLLLGVATSAYQVEGAWNEEGRGESIWDVLSHQEGNVIDNSTGDVACDSYHRWKRDVDLVKKLGVATYRISISWSRVLPEGTLDNVNELGLKYYNDLILELTRAGIIPIVTLFHFDLPQKLQEKGGALNKDFPNWFADYADLIFSQFSSPVPYWITINEPIVYCSREIYLFPLDVESDRAQYICSKNMLLAHANGYNIYNNKYKPYFNGKVSIANNYLWVMESNDTKEYAELALQYFNGRFSHPILSENGGWPPLLEEFMEKFSTEKGYDKTLLEPLTEKEKLLIKGTSDFQAFNYYFGILIKEHYFVDESPLKLSTFFGKIGINVRTLSSYPPGIKYVMHWLTNSYPSMHGRDYLISENGCFSLANSTKETNEDYTRMNFIRAHVKYILEAIEEGESVLGYTYWSLMDNFEWTEGYTMRFGLMNVNFSTLEITKRLSANYFKCLIEKRSILNCDYLFDV